MAASVSTRWQDEFGHPRELLWVVGARKLVTLLRLSECLSPWGQRLRMRLGLRIQVLNSGTCCYGTGSRQIWVVASHGLVRWRLALARITNCRGRFDLAGEGW